MSKRYKVGRFELEKKLNGPEGSPRKGFSALCDSPKTFTNLVFNEFTEHERLPLGIFGTLIFVRFSFKKPWEYWNYFALFEPSTVRQIEKKNRSCFYFLLIDSEMTGNPVAKGHRKLCLLAENQSLMPRIFFLMTANMKMRRITKIALQFLNWSHVH